MHDAISFPESIVVFGYLTLLCNSELCQDRGRTPLHRAACQGKTGALIALIEAKADVDAGDKVMWAHCGEGY
jgi:ankyrin repeat protein